MLGYKSEHRDLGIARPTFEDQSASLNTKVSSLVVASPRKTKPTMDEKKDERRYASVPHSRKKSPLRKSSPDRD